MSTITKVTLNDTLVLKGLEEAKGRTARNDRVNFSLSQIGSAMVRRNLELYLEALREFESLHKDSLWLSPVITSPSDAIRYGFCHYILSAIVDVALSPNLSNLSYTSKANYIARRYEEFINMHKLVIDPYKDNMLRFEMQKRKFLSNSRKVALVKQLSRDILKGERLVLSSMSQDIRVTIGTTLLDIAAVSTGLVYVMTCRTKRRQVRELRVHPRVLKWIDEQKHRIELVSPTLRPMVIKPTQWTDWDTGGFEGYNRADRFIRARDSYSCLAYASIVNDCLPQRVCDTLGQTPFTINTDVLETYFRIKESNVEHLVPVDTILPPSIASYREPEFPWSIGASSEQEVKQRRNEFKAKHPKEYKHVMAAWGQEFNRVYGSPAVTKRTCMHVKALQARELMGIPELYFPHNCDFRGRIYPMTTFISTQGDDFTKALLKFSESSLEPLTNDESYKWFIVHGANCAGVDKVSTVDRIRWVADNHRDILSVAKDPIATLDTWANYDSPWGFLAFAKEYARVHDDPKHLVSTPVQFDGSCNGIQHYSAMLRDPVGARLVNLKSSTCNDKPEDLYMNVANVAMELLNSGYGGDEAKDSREYWLANGGITRKLAKRNTMTTPYGVTRYGMREQLIEDFKSVYGFSMIKHANYLSVLIYESIKTVVKAASEGMAYLRAVASKVMSYNPKTIATLNWIAPNGFHAIQVYANDKRKGIRIPSMTGTMTIKLPSDVSQLLRPNKQRNISAFSPNFIHSIDASHLCMTVDAMSKQYNVKNYAMIHDSFGVDANNASKLRRTLREQFVKLYADNDPLSQLVEHYANFGFDISDIPKPAIGSYDINEVLNSEYFFH